MATFLQEDFGVAKIQDRSNTDDKIDFIRVSNDPAMESRLVGRRQSFETDFNRSGPLP